MPIRPESIVVLHVDDDPNFAEMTAEWLEREDDRLTVDTATNPDRALDHLAAADGTVDCIVADYEMPGRDGIDFLQAVRTRYPELPFILFTGKGSEEIASDAISAGVTDYLQKRSGPDQYAVLANRITNAVEQYRSRRALRRMNERLDTVVSNLPLVLFALDSDGVFTLSEGRGLRKLGLESDEVVGRQVHDVYDEHEGIVADIERALDGETVQSVHEVDGVVFDTTYRPIVDETGDRITGVIGVAIDITDRIERQRELERERDRFEAVFEAIPYPAAHVRFENGENTVRQVNPAFVETFGHDAGDLEGQSLNDVIVPQDRRDAARDIDRAFRESGEVHRAVVRETTEGPREFLFRSRSLDIDDELEEGIGIYVDVTERRERERDLEQSRQLVETLSATSPDYTFVFNEAGEYLDVITGRQLGPEMYTDEELIGRTLEDILAPETADRIRETIRETLDREELRRIEYSVDTSSGALWYEAYVAPIPDGYDGDPAVLLSARDITDRKEREREVASQREKIRALHEVATDIDGCDTADAVYETVVEAAEGILDFDIAIADEAVEDTLVPRAVSSELTTEEYYETTPIDAEDNLAAEAYRTGEPSVVGDLRERDASPADPEFRAALTVPIGDRGVFQSVSRRPEAFDETDLELTELLAAHAEARLAQLENERRLRSRTEELERQNERLEEFASVVSHDLRNPLNVAMGRLNQERREHDSERLEAVAQAHERMQELIEDLLRLARRTETDEALESVSLSDAARQCWATVGTADATLRVETETVIRADRSRLRQLLENLIRNAVEHGGEHVTVTVGDLPEAAGFYVADDGPGIPPADREQVFELGYANSATGTGFGLGIVKRIVEAHGWSIHVTESAAGGARFEVRDVEIEA